MVTAMQIMVYVDKIIFISKTLPELVTQAYRTIVRGHDFRVMNEDQPHAMEINTRRNTADLYKILPKLDSVLFLSGPTSSPLMQRNTER